MTPHGGIVNEPTQQVSVPQILMLYAEIDIERRLLLARVAQLEAQVAKLTPKPKKAKPEVVP